MNTITHKQAIQFIHRRMDGMLKGNQQSSLDEHLASCDSCRLYANEMDLMPTRLTHKLQARWDAQRGPSQHVAEVVTAKARRIPMTNRISSAVKLFAGAMALLIMVLVGNFFVSRLQAASPSLSATGTADAIVASNDRLLAFSSDQNGNFDIYTMHADGSGLANLTNDPARDTNPKWSPDGRHIAFESDRDGSQQIYLMDADGSNVGQLTEGADHAFLSSYDDFNPWSPDGSSLLIAEILQGGASWKLYVPDGNGEQKTLPVDESQTLSAISWSPDGQHIALQVNDPQNPDRNRLYILNADGSDIQEFTASIRQNEPLFFNTDYHWSPDGHSLFFIVFSQKTNQWTAYEARWVDNSLIEHATTEDLMYGWWNDIYVINNRSASAPFEWVRPEGTSGKLNPDQKCRYVDLYQSDDTAKRSSNGNWVITGQCSNGDTWLYWANSDGTQIKQLLDSPISITNTFLSPVAWSQDEKFIVFSASATNEGDLYIVDVTKALESQPIEPVKLSRSYSPSWRPVSNDELVEQKPTAQPEQTQFPSGLIAFTSEQNGQNEIYTMRGDGSEITNITNNPANDYSPTWSLDGKRIFFISDQAGNPDIFSMDPDGSHLTQLTDNPGYDGFFSLSPTGEKIIYISGANNDANVASLVVMNADGSQKVKLTEPGSYIFLGWSPDGQKIVYQKQNLETDGPQDNEIHVSDTDGGNHYQWTAIIDEIKWEDGQHFVGYGWSGASEPPTWDLYRFNSDGTPPVKITSHGSRIVALYDHTHVVEDASQLAWYGMDDNPTPLHSWDVQGDCTRRGDPYIQETSQAISPDGKRLFITVFCNDGYLQFYFANADGSEVKQLTDFIVETSISNRGTWSPDGRYIITPIQTGEDGSNSDLYLFDIDAMLQDPSTPPVRLTSSTAQEYDTVWQPVSATAVKEQPAPEPTPTTSGLEHHDIGTNISNGEWIAFIAGKALPNPLDPNALTFEQDVYQLHPDGNGLVNITQFPAHYYGLQWSPDGQHLLFMREDPSLGKVDIMRSYAGSTGGGVLTKPITDPDDYGYSWSPNSDKIVFADASNGNYDIYTEYADGRNDPKLTQLTNDPGQDVGFAWSPDGSQIAFQRLNGDQLSVWIMNEDGSIPREVARGMGRVRLRWSMDGRSLYANSIYLWGDTKYSHLECDGCVRKPAMYRIDIDGPSVQQLHYEEDTNKIVGWAVYDASPNRLYFMSIESRDASVGLWGTWFYWDGNSVHEIGEMDPHQTCETTTGNILSEDISPNERFSVISNYCAGGFDLYLADREATEPNQRIIHLLRLPLDTLGQGGDGATLPIQWSPDGRWLIYDNGHVDMLLLDLEQAQQDPSTLPTLLLHSEDTADYAVFDLVWQPAP